MQKNIFVILSFILASSYRHAINQQDIKGKWYLNKWEAYHTLVFGDKGVFVDNSADTVFTLNYALSNDTLITWSKNSGQRFKNKIIYLTKDTLVLDGIQGDPRLHAYSRIKKN